MMSKSVVIALFTGTFWLTATLAPLMALGQPSPAQTTAIPATPEQALTLAHNTSWPYTGSHVVALSLNHLIERTLAEDLEIQASREKEKETIARQLLVKNKRILFFFRYFNPQYLEGSAYSDVKASEANTRGVIQAALRDNALLYYETARAALATYDAWLGLQQSRTALSTVEDWFRTGKRTQIDVAYAKLDVLKSLEAYQKAAYTLEATSQRLATKLHWSDLPPNTIILPEAVAQALPPDWQPPALPALPQPLDAADLHTQLASRKPDLQELAYRVQSLENLDKAGEIKISREQREVLRSSIKQARLNLTGVERAAYLALSQAVLQWQSAWQSLQLATPKVTLAKSAAGQSALSQKAGFASLGDLQTANMVLARARLNNADAVLQANIAQVHLLYESGLMTPEALIGTANP